MSGLPLRMSVQTTRPAHTAGSNLLVPMATFTVLPLVRRRAQMAPSSTQTTYWRRLRRPRARVLRPARGAPQSGDGQPTVRAARAGGRPPPLTFHGLRHTFATLGLRAGVPSKVVARGAATRAR